MRRISLALAALTTLVCAAAAARAAEPTSGPADIFSPDRVHTIRLTVSAQRWRTLEPERGSGKAKPQESAASEATEPAYAEGDRLRPGPAGLSYAYVKARVEFDGTSLDDVGLRFKGQVSYMISRETPRRPMKLDFARFVSGARFAGVATLNLNNAAFDPSQARETLAFRTLRTLGVPAPRTGHALVYLSVPGLYDREYLGLYALIEEVDKRFLKDRFDGADDGMLLKPEGVRGLAYLGEDWTKYERFNAKGGVEPKWTRRFIELTRLINRADDVAFRERIDSYLAVDEVLRYVAANAAIVNLDSFLSTGHNYYIYLNPNDGRAHLIPWDMNLAFGGYSWVASGVQSADLSVSHPHTDHNRLIERLLSIDEYDRAYRRYLACACDALSPASVAQRRAELAPVFTAAGRAAKESGREGRPSTRPAVGLKLNAPELWSWLTAREQSMRAQLDGTRAGFIPGFRDPDLLPGSLATAAPVAVPAMAAVDSDGDGLLSDPEIARAIARFFEAAGAAPDATADRPAITQAFDRLLNPSLRQRATPERWAQWLIKLADQNGDGRLDASELLATYRRHLPGVDHDHDGLMNGREILEAFAGAGLP
jgi:hypothetical protein